MLRGSTLHEQAGSFFNDAWHLLQALGTPPQAEQVKLIHSQIDAGLSLCSPGTDPGLLAAGLLNAAWLADLCGSPDGAMLEAARAALDQIQGRAISRIEWWLLEGRRCLFEGAVADGQEAFEEARQRALAEFAGLPSTYSWMAYHGLARAALATNDRLQARSWLQAALDDLDRIADRLAAHQQAGIDRNGVFSATAVVDDAVDLALAEGDARRAWRIADAALGRSRRQVDLKHAVRMMPPDTHSDWKRHVVELEDVRRRAASLRDDFSLTDEERARAEAVLSSRTRALADALTAPLLAQARRMVDPDAIGRLLGDRAALISARLRADGSEESWHMTRHGIRYHQMPCTDAVMSGATPLTQIERLYVAVGPGTTAWELPSICLPGGRPVAVALELCFVLCGHNLLNPSSSRATRPALVVADPRYDLERAEAHGPWIAERLDGHLLCGDEATGDAVREAMAGASLFHFSGHGDATVGALPTTELLLAEPDTLRPEEVLGDAEAPRGVVLNGCTTAGGFGEGTYNLPAAFLAAGSQWVLATVEPVPDEAADRFVRRFYERGGHQQPAAALMEATREDWGNCGHVWKAWRLLTQDPLRPPRS